MTPHTNKSHGGAATKSAPVDPIEVLHGLPRDYPSANSVRWTRPDGGAVTWDRFTCRWVGEHPIRGRKALPDSKSFAVIWQWLGDESATPSGGS